MCRVFGDPQVRVGRHPIALDDEWIFLAAIFIWNTPQFTTIQPDKARIMPKKALSLIAARLLCYPSIDRASFNLCLTVSADKPFRAIFDLRQQIIGVEASTSRSTIFVTARGPDHSEQETVVGGFKTGHALPLQEVLKIAGDGRRNWGRATLD